MRPLQRLFGVGIDLALARGTRADRVSSGVKGKLFSHGSLHGNMQTGLEAS